MSPYLFISFINNLINSSNSSKSEIQYEMIRQLIINSKEFTLLPKFIDLYFHLLNTIKNNYKNNNKEFTDDNLHKFTDFFFKSFFNTIVFPSSNYENYDFDKLK